MDNDCDSLIDDADSSITGQSTLYQDGDSDSYGGTNSSIACVQPNGYVASSTDCNDGSAAISPPATESCDSIDNDCDGLIDDADSSVSGQGTWYQDSDGDGFGTEAAAQSACSAPDGYVGNAHDCDDGNELIHEDGTEICDGVDNNCDGQVDEDDPALDGSSAQTWYGDEDGDGHGSESKSTVACVAPDGTVEGGQDCDDSDPTVYAGAPELKDGKDNNCDGLVDDEKSDPGCGGCSAGGTGGGEALWVALLPALALRRRRS